MICFRARDLEDLDVKMRLCKNVDMRTTLDLPDPLFRELKTRAARQGVKMKELLTAIIEDGLRGGKTARVGTSPARSPLPVARRATGVQIPSLSNAQIAWILDAQDAHARD